MKTPEENKCGMECIRTNVERICVKPEKGQCPRCEQLVSESLARIQQLESRLAQVERERDAAVTDLYEAIADEPYKDCLYCKDKEKTQCDECFWQWRGVCAENSKEDSDGKDQHAL